MRRRQQLILCLVVIGVAAFFRFYRIDAIPPGLFIDEAQDGLDAHVIQTGERFPVFIEGGAVKGRGREPLFHYLMAGMFVLRGPTTTSIRVTSAVIGLVTVVAFFFLCEQLIGLRVAFTAAVLLAVCRWHVTFSRIGMRAITVPLLIVLTLLAGQALARRRTTVAASVFGATVGLGFYTYQAFWIVPLALAPFLLFHVWSARREGRHTLRLLVAAGGACVIVLAPLIHYAIVRPDHYFARVGETSDVVNVRDNLQRVLFMLHLRGDTIARHNIPGKPLLDPVTGVAFVIGLFVLLKTIRTDPELKLGVLAFWLLPLLPSVVTVAAPHAMRALGAVPAVCLISAIGVNTLLEAVQKRRWLAVLHAPDALLVAVLAAVAVLNYRAYFEEWGGSEVVASDFGADIPRFVDYCADLAQQYDLYVCPYVYYSPNIRFLGLTRQVGWKLIADETAFTAADGPQRDRVYVCDVPSVNFVIDELYPQAEVVGRYSVYAAHSGKIVRVGKEMVKTSLTDEQYAEVRYFIGKTLADFRARRASRRAVETPRTSP